MNNKDFKVLLVYPNDTLAGVAPSNLAILAACLKRAGFSVKLLDCSMYRRGGARADDVRAMMGQVKKSNIDDYVTLRDSDVYGDFVQVVDEYSPNVIGFSVVDGTISFSLSFIDKIKNKKIPVVFGGVGATFNYDRILDTGLVDFVCIGEGEGPFVDLCNGISNNEDCSDIANICTMLADGTILKNPNRPLVDLESLPFPDFSIYDAERFYRPFMGGVVRMAQVDLDRGCPFSCTYCASPAMATEFEKDHCGKYYRVKSFDKVFGEIRDLVNNHGVNFLWISSETLFAMSLTKFTEFANRYIKEVNLAFWCQSRLDMFSEEKTELLYRMGCKAVSVGLEHGSEKIRKQLLNKRITDRQILKSMEILSKYDIIVTINNMIGLPDETRKNIFETIELSRRAIEILGKNYTLNVFIFMPFSGTKLRELCLQKGYIAEDQDVLFSLQDGSILNMPSISQPEIRGLEKTFTLYVRLPKSLWPQVKIAEEDNEVGRTMFSNLTNGLLVGAE